MSDARRPWWEPALVFAAALLRHAPSLAADVLADEDAGGCAARQLAAGASPYGCPRYLYPPTFAHVAAAAARGAGLHAFLVALRVATVAGGAALAWEAARVALDGRPPRARLALALGLAVAAPWLSESVTYGNVSALVAGVALVAMTRAQQRPLLAGAGFGAALLLKPAGLGALPVLLAARRELRPPMAFFAAATAVPAIGVALTPATTAAWLHQRQALDLTAESNVALARALSLLASHALPPAAVALAVVAAGAALARRWASGAQRLHALALAAATFALPRVWLYSLSTLVPAVAVGLVSAYDGLRARRERPREALAGVASLLAVAVLAEAEALAETPGAGAVGRGALALLPFAAACWLVARVPGGERGGVSGSSP